MESSAEPPDPDGDTQNFKLVLTILNIAVLTFLSQTFTGPLLHCKLERTWTSEQLQWTFCELSWSSIYFWWRIFEGRIHKNFHVFNNSLSLHFFSWCWVEFIGAIVGVTWEGLNIGLMSLDTAQLQVLIDVPNKDRFVIVEFGLQYRTQRPNTLSPVDVRKYIVRHHTKALSNWKPMTNGTGFLKAELWECLPFLKQPCGNPLCNKH